MSLTSAVADLVEVYVRSELADAAKYENRKPLDESGIYSLHKLVEAVYEYGFEDGASVERVKWRGRMDRKDAMPPAFPVVFEDEAEPL